MKTRPIARFVSSDAWHFLIMTTLICVCSAVSAQEPTGNDEEGVVIGTVAVKVAEPTPNSSFVFGARKLDKIKWSLTITKSKGLGFSTHRVNVASGSETHFLVKLKGGGYRFDQLVAQGFANFYFETPARFDVTPKTTTYIGRLEITIPNRMYEGPRVLHVVDSQDEAVEALKKTNPESLAEVRKGLMSIDE